jgi:hypothetical protein
MKNAKHSNLSDLSYKYSKKIFTKLAEEVKASVRDVATASRSVFKDNAFQAKCYNSLPQNNLRFDALS